MKFETPKVPTGEEPGVKRFTDIFIYLLLKTKRFYSFSYVFTLVFTLVCAHVRFT